MSNFLIFLAGLIKFFGLLGGIGFLLYLLLRATVFDCVPEDLPHQCKNCAGQAACLVATDGCLPPDHTCRYWRKD